MNEVAMIMPDLRWPGPIAMQEAMAPGAGRLSLDSWRYIWSEASNNRDVKASRKAVRVVFGQIALT